jgi:hypothetical protein
MGLFNTKFGSGHKYPPKEKWDGISSAVHSALEVSRPYLFGSCVACLSDMPGVTILNREMNRRIEMAINVYALNSCLTAIALGNYIRREDSHEFVRVLYKKVLCYGTWDEINVFHERYEEHDNDDRMGSEIFMFWTDITTYITGIKAPLKESFHLSQCLGRYLMYISFIATSEAFNDKKAAERAHLAYDAELEKLTKAIPKVNKSPRKPVKKTNSKNRKSDARIESPTSSVKPKSTKKRPASSAATRKPATKKQKSKSKEPESTSFHQKTTTKKQSTERKARSVELTKRQIENLKRIESPPQNKSTKKKTVKSSDRLRLLSQHKTVSVELTERQREQIKSIGTTSSKTPAKKKTVKKRAAKTQRPAKLDSTKYRGVIAPNVPKSAVSKIKKKTSKKHQTKKSVQTKTQHRTSQFEGYELDLENTILTSYDEYFKEKRKEEWDKRKKDWSNWWKSKLGF